MKPVLVATLALVSSLTLRAETPAPAPSPAPAAGDAAQTPDPNAPDEKAWAKLKTDFEALQQAQDEATARKLMPPLTAEARDFATKYPASPHANNATMLWAQLGQELIAHHWEGAPPEAEVDAAFDRLATDDKVPKPKRAEIRLMQISVAMQQASDTPDDAAKWDAIDARIADFEKNFGADFTFDGQHPVLPQLRAQELEVLATAKDPARFDALTKQLLASPQPAMAAMAKEMVAKAQAAKALKSKPVELAFTSVDGHSVDLSKLRGRVVLVDFWATWCGPCRGEVPNVVAAYQKYHDKGFEILGISLDQDKDALLDFTKHNGMVWPQYFDGQGWSNAISTKFGIDSIPAMWLIGKDGMLITTDAREDLAAQVEKALAAK